MKDDMSPCMFFLLVLLVVVMAVCLSSELVHAGYTEQLIDQAIEDISGGSQYAPQFLVELIRDGRDEGVAEWKIEFLRQHLQKPKRVLVDPYPRRRY